MKLAIVFEVPDEAAAEYGDIAGRIIEVFREGASAEFPRAWSFDLAMRPVGAAMAPSAAELVTALANLNV